MGQDVWFEAVQEQRHEGSLPAKELLRPQEDDPSEEESEGQDRYPAQEQEPISIVRFVEETVGTPQVIPAVGRTFSGYLDIQEQEGKGGKQLDERGLFGIKALSSTF
jgi:hypothetical protein